MGCCGQARAALRGALGTTPRSPRGALSRHDEVRVRNVRGESLQVRGTATGRTYVFTPGEPTQSVHPLDAVALLRSGHFRPVR